MGQARARSHLQDDLLRLTPRARRAIRTRLLSRANPFRGVTRVALVRRIANARRGSPWRIVSRRAPGLEAAVAPLTAPAESYGPRPPSHEVAGGATARRASLESRGRVLLDSRFGLLVPGQPLGGGRRRPDAGAASVSGDLPWARLR